MKITVQLMNHQIVKLCWPEPRSHIIYHGSNDVKNCVYRAGPIRTQYSRFDSMLPSAPRSALITNKDRGPCIWIATCASSCAACALCCALAKAIIWIRWTLFISEWLFTISTSHVVRRDFTVLAVQYHKSKRLLHTSVIQGSFTDTSRSNKTNCSFN